MKRKRPTFEHAKRIYVHRFTMDHVPAWARVARPDGKHYAPQYASDQEWYDNTAFPGEPDHIGRITECYSRNATWPLGMSLERPYHFYLSGDDIALDTATRVQYVRDRMKDDRLPNPFVA